MAVTYTVNGPATLVVDGGSAWYTDPEGVEIKVTQHRKEVFTDEFGEAIPAEIINLGVDAEITCTLAKYDPATLDTFVGKRVNSFGTMGTIGELEFAAGRYSTLVIASSLGAKPWTFNRVFVEDDATYNLSVSDLSRVTLKIRAVPNASGVTFVRT